MSEDNQETVETPESEGWIGLRILYNPKTQQVTVNGPMNDSILFLGMLEMAKIVLIENRTKEKSGERQIVIPMRRN